jgi:hypothetical protein
MALSDTLAALSGSFFWLLRGFYLGVFTTIAVQVLWAARIIKRKSPDAPISTTQVDDHDFPESIVKYLRDACAPSDTSRVSRWGYAVAGSHQSTALTI